MDLGPACAPGTMSGVEILGRFSTNVLPLPRWDGGTLFSAGCGGFWHWGHCCCSHALALGLGSMQSEAAMGQRPWLAGCCLPAGLEETHRDNLETCSVELSLTGKLSGSSGRLDLCFLQWSPKTTLGNTSSVSFTLKMSLRKGTCFRNTQ